MRWRALVSRVGVAMLVVSCAGTDGPAPGGSAATPSAAVGVTASSARATATTAAPRLTVPPTTVRSPSTGCMAPLSVTPSDRLWRVPLGDGARSYLISQGPGVAPGAATGVILLLHGLGSDGATVLGYSELGAAADRVGAIVVLPEAIGNQRRWSIGDLPYLRAVLDDVEARRCVDRERVWLAGLSMGGFEASVLACSIGPRIGALATVAGLGFGPEGCASAPSVPVLAFHGTADHVVAYAGAPPDYVDVVASRGAEADVGAWARHNGCAAGPVPTPVTDEVSLLQWQGCRAETALYVIAGGGHSWPGAEPHERQGYTTDDIAAADLIVEFFQRHPVPVPVP